MKTIRSYSIDGQPVPMPRPRLTRQGRAYMPKEFRQKLNKIRQQLRAQRGEKPELGPVKLTVRFFFSRPKAMMGKKHSDHSIIKTNRPDLDNCFKTIADAANDILYLDDAQIWAFSAEKYYCAKGEQPNTIITLETGDDQQ